MLLFLTTLKNPINSQPTAVRPLLPYDEIPNFLIEMFRNHVWMSLESYPKISNIHFFALIEVILTILAHSEKIDVLLNFMGKAIENCNFETSLDKYSDNQRPIQDPSLKPSKVLGLSRWIRNKFLRLTWTVQSFFWGVCCYFELWKIQLR